jgi:hypothetical protein
MVGYSAFKENPRAVRINGLQAEDLHSLFRQIEKKEKQK